MTRFAQDDLHGIATTVLATIVPGNASHANYRGLEEGPGEPLQVRNDFGGSRTSMRLRSIACFVQVSDLHVADVQSPARLEFADRLGDAGSPHASLYGGNRTYRAQEPFGHQVIESMAVAIRSLRGGPLTGAPIAFAISTGDAVDNCQGNELENYIALLDGDRIINPDSGDPSKFDGAGSLEPYDVHYWHPDGSPDGELDDFPRSLHGFPTVSGILDASRVPFRSTGLGLPWYAVYGNHDGLVGGVYPRTDSLIDVVCGGEKPIQVEDWLEIARYFDQNEIGRDFGDVARVAIRTRPIKSDASRRFVGTGEWIAAHRRYDGAPFGHGFDERSVEEERAYYAFDAGEIRCVVLDTVNRSGGWQGSIDDAQFRWLENELQGGHRRFIDEDGTVVEHDHEDRLFVLFSHHTIDDLVNRYDPIGAVRHGSTEVNALLGRFPNMICWFNGHTHENAVQAIHVKDPTRRGFWQVTTASHIDWPQQCRLIEIAIDESTGELVIATSCVDHAGLLDPLGGDLDDPATIAGWSRELAANAWQGRSSVLEPAGRGKPRDRNVALMMPSPFRLGRNS